MDENQDNQISNPESQAASAAELSRINKQLRSLRSLLRQTKKLKPKSESAVDSLDIEALKTSGEGRKRVRQKYATAVGRHEQLLALQARLTIQIFKLKARKEELENGTRTTIIKNSGSSPEITV